MNINPMYLPEVNCTPDHQIFATKNHLMDPVKIPAKYLTKNHYLAIPKNYSFSNPQIIEVDQLLKNHEFTFNPRWKLTLEERNFIMAETKKGKTSNEIGKSLNKSGSYIRHVRRKIKNGLGSDERRGILLIENGMVRFSNERKPGIPKILKFDQKLARLFGLYCAEGCVVKDKTRPNSYTTNFSFSHSEEHLIREVRELIQDIFGLKSTRVVREDTLAVANGKTTLGLLFKEMAGERAIKKKVPEYLYNAPRNIAESFINSYVEGDGHQYENGKISISTVSHDLAFGVAWLVLKLGYLPSIYINKMKTEREILGRKIKQAEKLYNIVWYKTSEIERHLKVTEDYYFVPINSLSQYDYDDYVYNLEVDKEHNYLANFFLVANCQNWITSQTLRNPSAGISPQKISPEEFVDKALEFNARLVTSTYNEPLITSEWAVEIFKKAKTKNLATSYVSNGNATPEVLDYIKPYTDLYKIDLKSFDDKRYRSLGGTLEAVLDTVKGVYNRGMWLEIVTLVIPGFNDSDDELRQIANFIVNISPDIPWHVTGFHKDYKMTDPDNTSSKTLVKAAKLGIEEGLRYVYPGNRPGMVGDLEHTRCPNCEKILIKRYGFSISNYIVTDKGACPNCNTKIAGIWEKPTKRERDFPIVI
jgi:pyruvate formate lyase activating enzyme